MCVICLYYISYVYASEEWKYKLMEFIGAECECHAFNFFFWDGKIFEIEKGTKACTIVIMLASVSVTHALNKNSKYFAF